MAARHGGRESGEGGRSFLEDLSLDLTSFAAQLAQYAEAEALRGEGAYGRVTDRQLAALIAGRRGRAAAFGLDLEHPGWTLLLHLYRAHLAGETLRVGRLIAATRLAHGTAYRWLDLFCAAGLAERSPDPTHQTGVRAALTPAGARTMADYLDTARHGWIVG